MARANIAALSFNAGELSPEILTRVDLERVRAGAETMTNWLPRTTGAMFFRPGTQYLGASRSNGVARYVPFVFNASDTALVELTNLRMRVWVGDAVMTRPAVTTTITNPDFTASVTGWTDDDDAGSASTWSSSGALELVGTEFGYARRYQQVTVSGGNVGVRHGLRIHVTRGPVMFRVGSSTTNDVYIRETSLGTGYHSLSFTPSGDFYIYVYSNAPVSRLVSSIDIEASGAVELTTPWTSDMLSEITYDQSGDVIFCAYPTVCQQRIERRDTYSWSIVEYRPADGPFRSYAGSLLSITPSARTGNISLTASQRLFRDTHVGALFKLTHGGQSALATVTGEDQGTLSVRVTGVNGEASPNARRFNIAIAGTFTATVKLQRSFGAEGNWVDVGSSYEWTAAVTTSYSDDFDNEIIYYRLWVDTGDYTSGTVSLTISYPNSSQDGIVRITAVTDTLNASAEVITTLGSTDATTIWREGNWSDFRGFPSSVCFHDGRLWWGASDTLYGSVSDEYDSFDQETEGDSGPIIRSVATGPADGLYWLVSSMRLIAGGTSQEVSIRSSSFDEPLTPTQFTVRPTSTRGCKNVNAVKADNSIVFVQRDGRRVFTLAYEGASQEYRSVDLTRLNPKICDGQIIRLAVQRQPETRIWAVLADGTARVLLYEPNDDVVGWSRVTTDGSFLDVCVLPGEDEDAVYFHVERSIGGTKRYLEKLGKESLSIGNVLSRNMDSFVIWTGSSSTTITGLDHLEGEQVVVWAGTALRDQSNMATVSSGSITVSSAVTSAVVGLPFDGEYKSMKLAFASELGTALNQTKRADSVGLLLANTAWAGIKHGPSLTDAAMRALPKIYRGATVATTRVFDYYDDRVDTFNGSVGTDPRVCLKVKSPYPATVLGIIIGHQTNEKGDPR